MSQTNFFVVKGKRNFIVNQEMAKKLIEYGLKQDFSIQFNIRDYCDELLKDINVEYDYFSISEYYFLPQTDDFFDINDCFTDEDFLRKFECLDKIEEIVFEDPDVNSIDFYFLDQSSTTKSDFPSVDAGERSLSQTLLDEMNDCAKKYRYVTFPDVKVTKTR